MRQLHGRGGRLDGIARRGAAASTEGSVRGVSLGRGCARFQSFEEGHIVPAQIVRTRSPSGRQARTWRWHHRRWWPIRALPAAPLWLGVLPRGRRRWRALEWRSGVPALVVIGMAVYGSLSRPALRALALSGALWFGRIVRLLRILAFLQRRHWDGRASGGGGGARRADLTNGGMASCGGGRRG